MTAIQFIVDENLPPHLVFWLRDKGIIATHVDYESLGASSDNNIWAWARVQDAIVVSKDQDFRNRLIVGKPPRLLWIRWGNTRKKPLIERLEQIWPDILRAFEGGEWLVELKNAIP
jgi:predicted nuclease of predicted toxin-antitoxin system